MGQECLNLPPLKTQVYDLPVALRMAAVSDGSATVGAKAALHFGFRQKYSEKNGAIGSLKVNFGTRNVGFSRRNVTSHG